MKKYGLRIGNIGIEFLSIDERDKAIKDFTRGTDVVIEDEGIKYRDGKGNFSVYDRDTKETITICILCQGEFGIETCNKRDYPSMQHWEKSFCNREGYICDACIAKQLKAEAKLKAVQLLNKTEDD